MCNNIFLNTGTNSQLILNKAWKVCHRYSYSYFGHQWSLHIEMDETF